MSEEIDNRPKNAFEAAIDAATGYKPGDEDGKHGVASDAVQDDKPDETNPGSDETKPGADETKPAEVKESAAPVKGKRDWVKEAWECFIKNAVDLEPTEPAGAVWEYFKKNATDELKAKVEAEGKTGASCWKFIEAVARKALGGHSGHIDPVAVYAIAMHYFQDVPKDWEEAEKPKAKARDEAKAKELDAKAVMRGKKIAHKNRLKLAKELGDKKFAAKVAAEGKELAKAEKEKRQKAKKRGGEQGFFFDLMETETVGPECGRQADGCRDGKEAGDAE